MTCSSTGSSCAKCEDGWFLNATGLCTGRYFFFRDTKEQYLGYCKFLIYVACTQVADCVSAITCTNAFNSKCRLCRLGYFVNNSVPLSTACTGMFNIPLLSSLCLRTISSILPNCDVACSPVADCNSGLKCTNRNDSICTGCMTGYFLNGTECASRLFF
jgi:hypothetical protein